MFNVIEAIFEYIFLPFLVVIALGGIIFLIIGGVLAARGELPEQKYYKQCIDEGHLAEYECYSLIYKGQRK